MRIGIYDPYLDDVGGGEKYMMTIASFLSQHNDVAVFWDKKEDLEAVGERFSLDVSHVKLFPNIFSSKMSTFARLQKTKSFDVIIALTDGSIPLVSSKKLFLHIQQPLEHMQLGSFLGKLKLSRVSGFFCNSEYTKDFIKKKFSISAQVIYPPVEFFPKNVKKENIILHVGRFRNVEGTDYKKQSVMIGAFKQMVDKGLKNWKFALAVSVHPKDKEAFEGMKQSAERYPVEFVINASNEALWETYSKAKIYWHASGYGEDLEKHPELAEHFGISTVEAMGAGAVPVVINAGGQREIVTEGENGLLWSTLEELEEKTLLLMKDVKLWQQLSDHAKKSVQRFGIEEFFQKITHLIT